MRLAVLVALMPAFVSAETMSCGVGVTTRTASDWC